MRKSITLVTLACLVCLALACQTGGAKQLMLFDGSSTDAWLMQDGKSPCHWPVKDGAMEVQKGGVITKQIFKDYKLHVEFKHAPRHDGPRANSGVYLQGCYEIQILDSVGETKMGMGSCGSIYSKRVADVNACTAAGTWQTFDITFQSPRWDGNKKTRNARVTVVHNGKVLHNDVEIDGHTPGGVCEERPEGGPLYLQDHGHPLQFRNIWIQPLDKEGGTAKKQCGP